MSDNNKPKQAPAVEAWSEPCASCDTPRACQYDGCRRDQMAVDAGARDERAAAFAAIHDFLGIAQKKIHPQPDKPNSDWAKLKAAVDALSHLAALARASEAAAGKPVATVESWTNGSYHRNYKLTWHKDVEDGTKLYAAPQPASAQVKEEK